MSYFFPLEQSLDDTRVDLIYNESLTYIEARKSCVKAGGDLVTLRNDLQLDELAKKLKISDVK